MLKAILPPVCLVLALALAVTGFAVIAFGGPEASISLHEARSQGDDLTTSALEDHLLSRQNSRIVFIVLLFASSVAMTFVAFAAMRDPHRNRQQR